MRRIEAVVAALVVTVSASNAMGDDDTAVETRAAPPRDVASQARVGPVELELAAPRSADYLLSAAPGVHVVQHGSEGKGLQLFLRGFDAVHGSDLAVSVAGIPLNEFSNVHGHGYVDLGFIVPEAVAHLDVTRGAYRLRQGSFATAGAIDLEPGVAPWNVGRSMTYEIGTTNRHRLVAMTSRTTRDVDALEALYDGGYGESRRTVRVGATSQRELARFDSVRVSAITLLGGTHFQLPGPLRLDDVEAERVDFYDSYQPGEGSSVRALAGVPIRGHASWGRFEIVPYVIGRSLSIEENTTGYLRFPERGDRRHQRESSFVGGANLRARVTRRVPGTVELLAEARRHVVRQREDQVTAESEPWQLNRKLDAQTGQVATGVGWDHVAGMLGWTLSMRGELFTYQMADETDLLMALAPRASARLLLDHLTLFLAAGRGYRAPEVRAVFGLSADDEGEDASRFDGGSSRIVVSNNAEIGARYEDRRVSVGATAFAVGVEREAVYDHVSGVNLELDSTRRLGAELDVEVRPRRHLLVGGDVTAVDARFARSQNPVPQAPRLLATMRAAVVSKRVRAGAVATLVGPRPLSHGAMAASSLRLGASAAMVFDALEVGVDVENLLGRQLTEGEVHYASWWDRETPRSSLPTVHVIAGPPLSARLHLTFRFDAEEPS